MDDLEMDGAAADIQWKGTDVCMDFTCGCGASDHIDGFFVCAVKCPKCDTLWVMPITLHPVRAGDETDQYWRENASVLDVGE